MFVKIFEGADAAPRENKLRVDRRFFIDDPASGSEFRAALLDGLARRDYTIAPPVVAVAQLVRAPGCGPGGRGFKSHQPPHFPLTFRPVCCLFRALARIASGEEDVVLRPHDGGCASIFCAHRRRTDGKLEAGVRLHRAAAAHFVRGLIAEDIADALPPVLRDLRGILSRTPNCERVGPFTPPC
jgi:hypothetical protein